MPSPLTLQPDGTAGIDTRINSASATTSYTIDIYSRVLDPSNRFLLKFDLSSIAGVTITGTTLYLYSRTTRNNISPGTHTFSRILAANSGWIENANWNYAVPSTQRWAGDVGANGGTDAGCSVSGTDFSATPLATYDFGSGISVTAGQEFSFSLNATEMNSMLTANHGMVIWNSTAGSTYFDYYTSDYTTASYRPKISVEYTEGGISSTIKTINLIAKASVKTVNGTAIASVKSINGTA
jgi:hypothetical protein